MSVFTLNIAIDATDLQVINLAGESLNIVLGVDALVTSASKSFASQPTVVWLAFQPFQSNVISFSDATYSIFAAPAMPASGSVIQVGSQATAIAGMVQAFQANGTFGPAQAGTGLGQNTFATDNLYPANTGYMVFGLGLAATVNGAIVPTTPVTARLTPNMQQAQFSPNYGMQVFLQTGTDNAMILPNFISAPVFQLSPSLTTLSVHYNSKIRGFQIV